MYAFRSPNQAISGVFTTSFSRFNKSPKTRSVDVHTRCVRGGGWSGQVAV